MKNLWRFYHSTFEIVIGMIFLKKKFICYQRLNQTNGKYYKNKMARGKKAQKHQEKYFENVEKKLLKRFKLLVQITIDDIFVW